MKKLIEKIIYSFGINISAYDVEFEIRLLKKKLPPSFYGRDVVDIGCGDGRVSKKLIKVLKPISFKGVDSSSSLITSAKEMGINVEAKDVAKQDLRGDLGVLWGVIHHFEKPDITLKKLYDHFNSLIIRAPVDEKRLCELGHKFNKKEFMEILCQAGIKKEKCQIIEVEKTTSLIIFVNRL